MLTHVHVRHFQALHDIELTLAPLTVIVGASSSGKSALIRALHTVTHNRRGTDWIEHGEQAASVTVRTEHHSVTLTRTQKAGDGNAYVLAPLSSTTNDEHQRFTKLGAAVPIEVSDALGIYPDGINFAGQHDMPFMLSTTGTQNATALGRLTNVHTIFEAAREANRQRQQSASTLRTRQGDIESLRAGLSRFKNLGEQRAAVERAEQALRAAHETSARLDRLRDLTTALRVITQATPSLQQAVARTVPSIAHAEQTSSTLDRLHELRGRLIGAVQATQQATAAVEESSAAVNALTDARAGLVANLSDDIERRMHPHAITHDTIHVTDAARVSAEYIRDVL